MKYSIAFLTIVLFFGCAGSTKVGVEVRNDAHQRMDVVNANLAAQQARQQFEVGNLSTALSTIDAAIDRFETKPEYHLLRGRILLELHQLDAAHKSLAVASTLAPDLAAPNYFLGVLHQRWSDDKSAIDYYKSAMRNDPSHPQYFMAVAETYVAIGQFDRAIEFLLESGKEFQHQPSVPALIGQIYLLKGDPEKAMKHFSDSKLLGNDSPEILTSIATAEFDAGMYANCLMTLQQLEVMVEGLAPIYERMRGKSLFATGRIQRGRDVCLVVTRKTPQEVGAWIDLGYIAWHMGDYERLGHCGEQILQLEPKLEEGSLFLGIAALHAGNEELARASLSSLQSDNDYEDLNAALGSVFVQRVKTAVETTIRPNMTSKFAEGGSERRLEDAAEVGRPLARVAPQSNHSP
ncbi:MAG: tetratricopeptide repeat protein [Planctomycetota bacterium]|nr:tetratricopeptide repeat protein [Planctomycetota bacterium]